MVLILSWPLTKINVYINRHNFWPLPCYVTSLVHVSIAKRPTSESITRTPDTSRVTREKSVEKQNVLDKWIVTDAVAQVMKTWSKQVKTCLQSFASTKKCKKIPRSDFVSDAFPGSLLSPNYHVFQVFYLINSNTRKISFRAIICFAIICQFNKNPWFLVSI